MGRGTHTRRSRAIISRDDAMLHAESATLCVTGRKARAMHRSTSIVRAFPRCTGALVFMLVLRRSYTVHAASRRESAVSSHEGSDWVLKSACAVLKAAARLSSRGRIGLSQPLARFSTCRLRGSQYAACAVLTCRLRGSQPRGGRATGHGLRAREQHRAAWVVGEE